MSDAENKTSIIGNDNPSSVGYGVIGIARDAAKPPFEGGGFGSLANHGVGVLGLAGNLNDTERLKSILELPGSPFSDPQPADENTNMLHLQGPLPEAGVCGIATLAQQGSVGVLGYKNTGEPNGALGFLAGTARIFNFTAGVYGDSHQHGVVGNSNGPAGAGVFGFATGQGTGIAGNTAFGAGTGVLGHTSTGVGVLGDSDGSGPAGRFVGNVEINNNGKGGGNLTINGGGGLTINNGGDVILADCAEDFQLASGHIEAVPGSVMVLDEMGTIRPCSKPYDKCAVGVVSGAGPYRPAIVFDRTETSNGRLPISLVGKVCCMVDATFGAIEVGDLLTTSPTPGHAMKADDPLKAFGAVIGKALQPLAIGKGLIPILVALQ